MKLSVWDGRGKISPGENPCLGEKRILSREKNEEGGGWRELLR